MFYDEDGKAIKESQVRGLPMFQEIKERREQEQKQKEKAMAIERARRLQVYMEQRDKQVAALVQTLYAQYKRSTTESLRSGQTNYTSANIQAHAKKTTDLWRRICGLRGIRLKEWYGRPQLWALLKLPPHNPKPKEPKVTLTSEHLRDAVTLEHKDSGVRILEFKPNATNTLQQCLQCKKKGVALPKRDPARKEVLPGHFWQCARCKARKTNMLLCYDDKHQNNIKITRREQPACQQDGTHEHASDYYLFETIDSSRQQNSGDQKVIYKRDYAFDVWEKQVERAYKSEFRRYSCIECDKLSCKWEHFVCDGLPVARRLCNNHYFQRLASRIKKKPVRCQRCQHDILRGDSTSSFQSVVQRFVQDACGGLQNYKYNFGQLRKTLFCDGCKSQQPTLRQFLTSEHSGTTEGGDTEDEVEEVKQEIAVADDDNTNNNNMDDVKMAVVEVAEEVYVARSLTHSLTHSLTDLLTCFTCFTHTRTQRYS